MTDQLDHRGPDDRGVFAEHNLALGFRRLAILDLAPSGRQPMVSADGRHVIVFNGAIYNFVELRAELEALGHVFRSSGDTEVLLNAYREWGSECLRRFNGMWSFVIYDRIAQRLFGARDRFGVKPLFWYRKSDYLVLASEIKAMRHAPGCALEFNAQSVAAFLLEGSLDTTEETFYQDVRHVPAGMSFECDMQGHLEWRRYWSLPTAVLEREQPTDPVAEYADLFEDAVRLRMRSDVSVGVQLSGGIDSTSILAAAARHSGHPAGSAAVLSAFCYRDPAFDESEFIEATLAQTCASPVSMGASPTQLWDAIGTHLWYQDEPVHSFSSVVGYKLMELARSGGVKVLLNGQGADEVLGGYPNYFDHYWAHLLRTGHLGMVAKAARVMSSAIGCSATLELASKTLRRCFGHAMHSLPGYAALAARRRHARVANDAWVSGDVKQSWQPHPIPNADTLDEVLRDSVERMPLPLYLRVEDRNSMAHGLELRLPFLDYRLVVLAFRLEDGWKLSGAHTKAILRQAMLGRIPEKVRTRLYKFGFPTAAEQWFRTELYAPLRDLLQSRNVRESGLWNVPRIEQDLERHRRGEVSVADRLFDVVQLCLLTHRLSRPVHAAKQP